MDSGFGRKKKGDVQPSINVTPLVDVVLVLLIIFMIITPLMTKQFWVHIPKQEKQDAPPVANDDYKPLVLTVTKEDKLLVNNHEIDEDELTERLKRMFAARTDHVLFIDVEDEAKYGTAVRAMDKARAGGAVTIAILTERPQSARN
jgi:biopolymer transport protein TolR